MSRQSEILGLFSGIFAFAAAVFSWTGVGAGALAAVSSILGISGTALYLLAKAANYELGKHKSLAFKITFTKGIHIPIWGYAYWSSYAWTLRG